MSDSAGRTTRSAGWRTHVVTCGQVLAVVMAFLLPGKLAPLNVLSVLIILAWLISFQKATHWVPLKHHSVFWAFQAYFWLIVVGMLWTQDVAAGTGMVSHALALAILAPPLLTLVTPPVGERMISAFLAGIAICVVLAHYNWLQLVHFPHWPANPLDHNDPIDTAPFTGWVSYAPMLAMAAYLAGRRVLTESSWMQAVYVVLILAVVNNLIFSGGRTGVVAFCALVLLVSFRLLRRRPLTGALAGVALVVAVLSLGYLFGGEYRERLDRGLSELADYRNHKNGSVSSRLVMAEHTWEIIRNNPLVGVGTGDWRQQYKLLNDRFTPGWILWREPHNQYLLTQSTIGIAGLLALLAVYFPLGLRRLPLGDGRDDLRVAVAVWFAVISVFASYLWDSHTKLVFILFMCVAWSGVYHKKPPGGDSVQ